MSFQKFTIKYIGSLSLGDYDTWSLFVLYQIDNTIITNVALIYRYAQANSALMIGCCGTVTVNTKNFLEVTQC